MTRRRFRAALLTVAAVGALCGTTAQADDFYLRAGVGLDRSEDTRFKDKSCSSTSPAALYGCGTGNDGAPLSALGDFGRMAGFELGIGRALAPALRLEAVLQPPPRLFLRGPRQLCPDLGQAVGHGRLVFPVRHDGRLRGSLAGRPWKVRPLQSVRGGWRRRFSYRNRRNPHGVSKDGDDCSGWGGGSVSLACWRRGSGWRFPSQ